MASSPAYVPPKGLRTPLEDFMDYVSKEYNINIKTYDTLHSFSITRMNDFWLSFWKYSDIKASHQPTKIFDESIPIDQFPQFFSDAQLNYAENILCGRDEDVAIIEMSEKTVGRPAKYSWGEMRRMVARHAEVLRRQGIGKGDYMVLVGSNCARSLAILLASASIGAVIACFATDIGEKALNDRLSQLRPKLIISEVTYTYNGKKNTIAAKLSNCFSVVSKEVSCRLVTIGSDQAVSCEHSTIETLLAAVGDSELRFEQVPFNTPMLVMFSSGTTGAPKGIVHGHGGLVLNGKKEFLLHNGFGPEDVHIHFSNIGWTLWNISLGALLCKTPMVLYDGSPFYPTPEKLLRAIFSQGVTGFGAGPRYYAELQKHNVHPRHFAPTLHTIYSTGAVLTSSLSSWLAEAFGPVCQIQFSGGTELCGSFFHGTRSLPSYAGECAVKELGMDVDVFDDQGKSAKQGERGELVRKKGFPNMPVMFLNDAERKRYHAAYLEGFNHVWTHGDFIRVNPETSGVYVLGRSDGVLNPSGIRFGSAEMYTVLESTSLKPLITDALVVGQQRSDKNFSDSTERVILFVKPVPSSCSRGIFPQEKLVAHMKEQIVKDLSRRHVPSFFFEVDEIPYNVNGKKLETLVKKIINGGPELRARLKMTEDEARMMKKYEKYYDVDAVVPKAGTGSAKL